MIIFKSGQGPLRAPAGASIQPSPTESGISVTQMRSSLVWCQSFSLNSTVVVAACQRSSNNRFKSDPGQIVGFIFSRPFASTWILAFSGRCCCSRGPCRGWLESRRCHCAVRRGQTGMKAHRSCFLSSFLKICSGGFTARYVRYGEAFCFTVPFLVHEGVCSTEAEAGEVKCSASLASRPGLRLRTR